MNAVIPDADPAGLPAPLAILRVLLILTFVLHIVPMNVMLGGGLVAGWAAMRGQAFERAGRTADAARMQAITRGLVGLLPVATAFAVTFGIAPLLFVQTIYGQLFYTSSVLMAWVWLGIVPLVMAGYYGYHALASRHGTMDRVTVWLAFGSATLFLVTALVFTMNMTLMLRPERFRGLYAASELGFHLHLDEPMLWPRFLHFVVAAFAVTGLAIAVLGAVRAKADPPLGAAVRAYGVRLFLVSTLIEFAVGTWFLFSLPAPVRAVFLGGWPGHTSLLAASVLMAVLALIVTPRSLAGGSGLLLLTLGGMAVVRHRVRALMLAPVFAPGDLVVRPQWGAFAIFAVLLVAGLAVVVWMAMRLARARPPEDGR